MRIIFATLTGQLAFASRIEVHSSDDNAVEKGPCPDYFGSVEGVHHPEHHDSRGWWRAEGTSVISVVDPDVGHTEASAPYCRGSGMPTPCSYIHYAGPATECQPPGPPDGCHRYNKVEYSECDELKAFSLEGRIDTANAFDAQGVYKACADNVINHEVSCWGPPADEPVACECPPAMHQEFELLHEFNHVDYDWDSFPFTKEEAIRDGLYKPEKCTVTGIKQWKDTLYVTSPRWLHGVPTSLNSVVQIGGQSVLRPFPSYETQVLGDASSIQYIQSMEIDRRGWMWIIDVGRHAIMEAVDEFSGAPKLWIWDIDGNRLVHEYLFPDRIASHQTSFLNDIFVDDVRDVAYISETSGTGALLVYDLATNRARRWDSHPALSFESPLPPFTVEGFDINRLGPLPVDGLALAPQIDRVFFTPIHGVKLYSVSASLLRDFSSTNAMLDADVQDHGAKSSQCDGLTVSDDGMLYMSMLTSNSVEVLDVTKEDTSSAATVVQDPRLFWPDTFGWATDEKGGLLVSGARLEMLFLGDWPSSRVNVGLFRIPTAARSYLHALGPLRGQ